MKIISHVVLAFAFISVSPYLLAEDYSKITQNNPFKKYEYNSNYNLIQKAPSDNKEVQTYFTNKIQNPISIKKSSKYINLVNNSQKLNGCWDKAGAAYNVDPWLLFSIAKVESGFKHNATNVNKNNSVDIGMMQINTIWLPTLKKFGIERDNLFDPCTSVFVGAWIVAQNIRRFGYNQDGIGAYNSPGNITIRRNYAKKVYAAYYELTRDFGLNIQASR